MQIAGGGITGMRMKFSRFSALSAFIVGIALTGCEPHSFEETKGLHEEHGHGDHHGKEHAKHAEDGHAKEAHGEKPAEAHAEKPAAAAPEAAKPATEAPRKTGL